MSLKSAGTGQLARDVTITCLIFLVSNCSENIINGVRPLNLADAIENDPNAARASKFTKSPERESVPSLPLSVPAILLFSGPVQASQSALVARFVFSHRSNCFDFLARPACCRGQTTSHGRQRAMSAASRSGARCWRSGVFDSEANNSVPIGDVHIEQ